MDYLPHLSWLRSFEVAARLNSFSAAAAELNLTPAAVSQQIGLLESHLGAILFKRLPRGVALTDVGQAYAEPIRKSLMDMSEATRGLFGGGQKQTLFVQASISYAALVLSPRLSQFHDLYPDIQVQLSTSVWAGRFEENEMDLEIRYGHGNWEEDEILHLGHDRSLIVCHPDYAAYFGKDLTVQTLAQSEVIQILGSETSWIKMSDYFGLDLKLSSYDIKVDSSLMALQAVSSGRGAAIVLEQYAQWHLDAGLLISPFDYRLPNRPSLYAVTRPGAKKRDEIRSFCQWLSSIRTDDTGA